MGIEQKVAVITGASQGIGAALVKAYRDRNYRVVATARSVKPLRRSHDVVRARAEQDDCPRRLRHAVQLARLRSGTALLTP
jgi:short-subunit dehydrogenase